MCNCTQFEGKYCVKDISNLRQPISNMMCNLTVMWSQIIIIYKGVTCKALQFSKVP